MCFKLSRIRGLALVLGLACAAAAGRPAAVSADPACQIYVDPSAVTLGDGTIGSPFKFWALVSFAPGCSYRQRAGTVAQETIVVATQSDAAQPMTIGSYGTGDKPVLRGSVVFSGAAYVRLEGVVVERAQDAAVVLTSASRHVTLSGVEVRDSASGVEIRDGSGLGDTIEDCEIHDNDAIGIAILQTNSSQDEQTVLARNWVYRNGMHGIQVGGDYYLLEENEIHNNGISGTPGTSGIHLYSPAESAGTGDYNVIRNNRISSQHDTDGWDGNGIGVDHFADHNAVYGNAIFANHGAGIIIHDAIGNDVHDNVLYGNVVDPGRTRDEIGDLSLTSKSAALDRTRDNNVHDNIVVATQPRAPAVLVDGETLDNPNLIGGNSFLHEAGGSLWSVGGTHGNDLAEWNAFAAGGGDDTLFDPTGWSPPASPPASILDDSFETKAEKFKTIHDGSNVILGSPEADEYVSGDSDDVLVGGGGNDHLVGAGGADWLVGNAGDDLIEGGDGPDFLLGGLGNDTILGGDGDDQISGGDGDDHIDAGPGNDTVLGGFGDDWIEGGPGDDNLRGGDGNDHLHGGPGIDLLEGGPGDDVLDDSDDTSPNTFFGQEGNDTLLGGAGDDVMSGGPGNDYISGGAGDDRIYETDDPDGANEIHAGEGNDIVIGGGGPDRIYGGPGNDILDGRGGNDEIYGDEGDDVLTGGEGSDHLVGGPGDDRLDESADLVSHNVLEGGDGNDVILCGQAGDWASGGPGNDIIRGGNGNDVIDESSDPSGENYIDGGAGDDTIQGGGGSDHITGGPGNDVIRGGGWVDTIDGGDGDDWLSGEEGIDFVRGGPGNDVIDESSDNAVKTFLEGGPATANILLGEDGDDLVIGSSGDDLIYGGAGRDELHGGAGADAIFGGTEDDRIYGEDGDDVLDGEEGNDYIDGGPGDDKVIGGPGDDHLLGGPGADGLDGGDGNDVIDGGADNDLIVGGAGDDVLTGGGGVDHFLFDTGSGHDVITDFGVDDLFVVKDDLNGSGIHSVADLMSRLTAEGGDTIVDLGAGQWVRLKGILPGALTAANFKVVS